MKVVPLAAESLGTRSMATWIGCSNNKVNFLIDPGVSLAKKRFGLKPHVLEVERNLDHWTRICTHLEKSQYVIVSHYHYDHYNPRNPSVLRGKILFVKSPKLLNKSQRMRSKYFLEQVKDRVAEVNHADWRSFELEENIELRFSGALPHGREGSKQGFVVSTTIVKGKDIFTHTSDVLGIQAEVQLQYLLDQDPTILYVDGPMVRSSRNIAKKELQKCISSLETIIGKTQVKKIIIDHHLLRSLNWRDHLTDLLRIASSADVVVSTAAKFLGERNDLLEANRHLLYQEQKVNSRPTVTSYHQ